MKYWVTYPIVGGSYDAELVSGAAIARFTRAAEAAGFDGIGFTDHPAPSDKWLRSGGHDALDPFAALAFAAANSERLQLIPNIVVLPYRNPFLVAKLSATLDALSGGRFVLSTALGYLRSEYRSLGVDFQARNELFDEALQVLRGVWSTDAFAFEGTGYTASGVSANPKPGHVPIWIGGNSQRTRRRVAEFGDGWNPFPASEVMAQTTGTVRLETVDDLSKMLDYLWPKVEEAGRDRASIDVAFTAAHGDVAAADFDAAHHLDLLGELSALGVTWNGVSVPGDSTAHALESLAKYGETVITPSRK
ncbi:MAG TPA: LLM class F420-dependent oxidoreductase [Frankiaceae bacterium]|nr:LLM class F420-dependent oxidoreductase [Frankiaceae bacterium]